MKIIMENLQGTINNLRMMGVPISVKSYIYGENISVIHNTQRPKSTLKKKRNYIFYHAVRESVRMGDYLPGHVNTYNSCADLGINVFDGGKRRFHVSNLLYGIYDDL